MKTILTVVGDGAAGPVLETALLAARRFDGHIVALNALTTEYAVVFGGEMGFSISTEVDRTLERESQERRRAAQRLFREFCGSHHLAVGVRGPGMPGPSAEWREAEGRQNVIIGTLGRVFDLIVVERPAKLASLAEATLEDALFESGRPVLMAPPRPQGALGDTIMIAWNGSSETARAVALAMPFLKRARRVAVVSVEGGMVPGPSSEELARSLSQHGIEATSRHAAPPQRTPGEAYLDEAAALGADLIIKGAYTQSRLRQMIFGGATRHLIMAAELPILFAH